MVSRNFIYLISLTIGGFIGIIIGALFFAGFLPEITLAVIAILAISIALILYLIVSLSRTEEDNLNCYRIAVPGLLIGTIGTIIFSIFALAIGLFIADILSAILVALIVFFFIFTIISTIYLIKCLLKPVCNTEYYRNR